MTKEELKEKLSELVTGDKEVNHALADDLLLEFIGDEEITNLFNQCGFWYN